MDGDETPDDQTTVIRRDSEARHIEFEQLKSLGRWLGSIIAVLISSGLIGLCAIGWASYGTLNKLAISQEATAKEISALRDDMAKMREDANKTKEQVLKMWYGGGWDGPPPTSHVSPGSPR